MTRAARIAAWTAATLFGLIVLVVGALLWILNTEPGTRWIANVATSALQETLAVDAVNGTIAGPLSLRGLRYTDPVSGLEFGAREIDVDLALRSLLHATVQIDTARLAGLRVKLGKSPPDDDEPFSLKPPIDLVLRQLAVSDVDVIRDGEPLVVVTSANAAASWTNAGIAVSQLDVKSPQGEVHFKGQVAQQDVIVGGGAGRFRWRAGDLDYAGSLRANTKGHRGVINVELHSPMMAKLDATVDQSPTLAWSMVLDVPEFDPRKTLLPDSSFASLATRLNGHGTQERANLAGTVTLNGETLTLDSLQVALIEHGVDLNTIIRLGNGVLHARGNVITDAPPTHAQLALDWKDLDIPAQWAGQVLHTQGRIDLNGSTEAYAAKGSLSIGPDKRIANVELDVKGTGEAVQLQRFDIIQPGGRLASTGSLTLKPAIGWSIDAHAQQFDPGAFAAAWSGTLSFVLKSAGSMTDNGPDATLVINDLKGRLRNRALSGAADLSLRPGMLLSGVMDMKSGGSTIHLDGRSQGDSTNPSLNAVATARIATLADWVPDASGALTANVTASGKWPQLTIVGDANGSALHYADNSANALALKFNATNPQQPSGSAKLQVIDVAAAGFRFDTLNVTADGAAADHRVTLRANGSPLATDLAVQGSLQGETWSGTVQTLVVDMKNAARLTLQQPAQVRYARNAASISQACFADRDIRLCLQGDLAADGAVQATYSLQHVPLSLANALAPGALPVAVDGTLEGEGHIARSAQGTLSGEARLSSPAGKISQPAGTANETPPTLLTYENLNLVADLNDTAATAKLSAQLDKSGSLTGDVAVDGLGTATTNLHGQIQAMLPSVKVVEVFAPQLANVDGRLQLQAQIAGTLDRPDISGSVNLAQLVADVPELGLKLKNGQFTVTPHSGGQFALQGGIDSGDGKLQVDGTATQTGTAKINVRGDRFLAADIPGAKVLVTPDLNFSRTAEQMSLTGKVTVPEATVNLQKLPRGTRVQHASDDVIVVETAQTQQDAAVQAVPLVAEITVILGDKVDLTGFGLEAKVAGQLIVRERPGSPTTGSGEIRVAGTYKAYGQDLTVQQGQLLFAGTPLDNPRLNIVAVRTIEDVNAGLRVTGTAQNPQLTVFSDPPMGQANALSYLVTGKPLDQVGSANEDSDALQSAARSLGTAAGGLLARKIGGRLGVDEVGIKDSEAIGGSAFTVGQYLSPRLYLSYGVGLFQPGEVVTLRYKLKESLAIQAERGPKDTRAGVEYRIEK